ncbi:MAG TPA: ROK family protein [Acidimicrobiales bacterium]|nr:ROK family protein [Acidimicrobiales bacterium]
MIALDLGGTRLKAGRVDAAGLVVERLEPRPSGSTWDEARESVEKAVAELGRGDDDGDERGGEAVALAMPGVIHGGRVLSLPGKFPGAEGFDVASWLGGPVVNDAVAAGVGEARAGAGVGCRRVVVVTLGTGVGVCVLEDGRPLGDGPFGGGILAGQLPLGDGTIESRCRATASVDVECYRADVAAGMAALATAFGPGRVVVGGGAATTAGLFDGLEDAVNAQLRFGLRVEVRRSALGDDAALVGLALLS